MRYGARHGAVRSLQGGNPTMNHRNIGARCGALCALFLALMAGWPLASTAQNTHSLPLVLPAGGAHTGFVRIGNNSSEGGTVRITAVDDTGARTAAVTLSLDANETVNFNSRDLEQGNASKGLPVGVGDGSGSWRLFLETALNITPLAYIRTADGFVTAMHDVAPETAPGSRRYRVVFINPGANRNQVSRLRLINPGSTAANVEITGRDDAGDPAPGGSVRLTLAAGASRTLTAQVLEAGTGLDGRLGDGAGKWWLTVSSNVDIQVMSLLRSPTGHLANLSTAPMHAGVAPTGPMTEPEPNIDITVSNAQARRGNDTFMVGISIMNVGDVTVHPSVYTLTATFVEPNGSYGLPFLTYGFPGREITPSDFVIPRFEHTFSINNTVVPVVGATVRMCIEPVPGETKRTNNCMTATVGRVDTTPPSTVRHGAIATGWVNRLIYPSLLDGKRCRGIGLGIAEAQRAGISLQAVNSRALAECSQYSTNCRITVNYGANSQTRCGVAVIGARSATDRCVLVGATGANTVSAIQNALARCRRDLGGGVCRLIPVRQASSCISVIPRSSQQDRSFDDSGVVFGESGVVTGGSTK